MALTYGAKTDLTVTNLQSLANSTGYWKSAEIDNSSDLFQDADVYVGITKNALGASGYLDVYLYGSDGTLYPDEIDGAEGTFTPAFLNNLVYLGTMYVGSAAYVDDNTVYDKWFHNVAAAFGSIALPKKWGIAIRNLSGATLRAAGNKVSYLGKKY